MFFNSYFLIKRLIHRICVMISGQEKKEEKTGKGIKQLGKVSDRRHIDENGEKGTDISQFFNDKYQRVLLQMNKCCVSLFLLAFTYLCNVIVVCLCFASVAYCRCFPKEGSSNQPPIFSHTRLTLTT